MNSLRYFTSYVTYDINEYNNPFFIIYLISGFLLFFSILSLFTEKTEHQINDDQLLNYLEEISYDNDLLEKCRKVLFPDKGDVVTLLGGKWTNLVGHITKYNHEEDDYNIKVYKSDNLNTNIIPKRRIFRNRSDFMVNTDI